MINNITDNDSTSLPPLASHCIMHWLITFIYINIVGKILDLLKSVILLSSACKSAPNA